MTDELNERLDTHASQGSGMIDPSFADRLEAKLRVEHAALQPRGRSIAAGWLPRLGLALTVVVAGIAGVMLLRTPAPELPIDVVADQPIADPETADEADLSTTPVAATVTPTTAPIDESAAATANDDDAARVAPTATATATATIVPSPTPPQPAATPSIQAADQPTPSPNPVPTQQPTPTVAVPPTSTALPTTAPVPAPSPQPVSTSTPVPTPTVEPTATATPQPTPTVAPAPITMTCVARQSEQLVAVSCEWDSQAIDGLTAYELMRSRNGTQAIVISRQRAGAPTMFIDQDLAPGDRAIYLVQGLDADRQVLAASIRQQIDLS